MRINRGNAPNITFEQETYDAASDCRGTVYKDKISSKTIYELWDGRQRYIVPQEVFFLWLKSYESGREEGIRVTQEEYIRKKSKKKKKNKDD